MGTTPKFAIPYIEPSDLLANYPTQDKASATQIEKILYANTWTNVTAASSGTARYALVGGLVILQIDIAMTTVSGTIYNYLLSPMPAGLRPPFTQRAYADYSGWPGGMAIGTDGMVSGRHNSGANRSNVSGTLLYTIA